LVFVKPLFEIKLDDITALQQNKIHESDILDYKTGMLDDDSLVKHVTAFANSNGGYMIFGVEGTGKGGFPKAILGIDSEEVKRVLGPAKHGT